MEPRMAGQGDGRATAGERSGRRVRRCRHPRGRLPTVRATSTSSAAAPRGRQAAPGRRDVALCPHGRCQTRRRGHLAHQGAGPARHHRTRTPQDGRFRFELGIASVDLRVSIMPSVFARTRSFVAGQAHCVSRRRGGVARSVGLGQTVRTMRELAELRTACCSSGPPASGRPPPSYAMLWRVTPDSEDHHHRGPGGVELAGCADPQSMSARPDPFAKGLRSILRHDPDRILVGETATQNGRNAVQSRSRATRWFTDRARQQRVRRDGALPAFGLDMFGFMSSLNGVIVQRLVRRLVSPLRFQRARRRRANRRWLDEMG